MPPSASILSRVGSLWMEQLRSPHIRKRAGGSAKSSASITSNRSCVLLAAPSSVVALTQP
eukprot:9893588-Karenia_brevis.AAC.1